MRTLLLCLIALVTPAYLTPLAAPDEVASLPFGNTGAICTLDAGSVTAGGQTVRPPTVSYPCP